MIICVVGPTGVGKSELAEKIAQKYNCVVLNGDAFQIYEGMNIGTNKISKKIIKNNHYLFDFKSINDVYNVFNYQKDGRKVLNEHQNVVIVGGSGLYIKALLEDYNFNGQKSQKKIYDYLTIGLMIDRDILYKKIDNRVDKMIENGLVDEVKQLYEINNDASPLLKAIGYKEIISYLKEECSLEEAINNIKKNTRHYAKRQYTWFKHQTKISWFDPQDIDKIMRFIDNYLFNS